MTRFIKLMRGRNPDPTYRVRIRRRRLHGMELVAANVIGAPMWAWECECAGVPNLSRSQEDALAAACGHLKRGHQ